MASHLHTVNTWAILVPFWSATCISAIALPPAGTPCSIERLDSWSISASSHGSGLWPTRGQSGSIQCYSRSARTPPLRLNLLYHTPHQVIWGLGIGSGFGVGHYVLTELLPHTHPLSVFGSTRAAILAHPVVTWLQIRDGWAIWADGGRETEWKLWKTAYDEQRTRAVQKRVN